MSKQKVILVGVAMALIAGGAFYFYVGAAPQKSAPTLGSATSTDVLVLTAPPRETAEEGELTYKPVADYLSQVIGKRVVYRHPGTWGVYRTELVNGKYDIVFDGAHFVDFRVQKLSHNVLAKMPDPMEFAIIVRKEEKVSAVAELAGQTFCTQPPPNQGALLMMSQFSNPAQQPVQVPAKGWPGVYEGVVSGKCKGGVIVVANLVKLDKDGATKIIFKTPPQPNQAFTASPRITPADQAKIAAALTSPEASGPTAKLREAFKIGEKFVSANNAEYTGFAELLKNEWGFN